MAEIRLAEKSDIDAMATLLGTLFDGELEFKPDRQRQISGLTGIVNNPQMGEIFVYCEGGKVVGMVSLLYSISTFLGGKVAILEDMVVSHSHRNRGLGSQLLAHAIKYARETGCLRITLLTDNTNHGAIKFYEKQGFYKSPMIPLRLVF